MKWTLGIGVVYFILGLITLPHYGINWDTVNHLPRGQAYLHYFLTGKQDYSDLPKYFADWFDLKQWYWQNPSSLFIDTNIPKSDVPQRSMYQINGAPFSYFINHDGGHPPLSDIFSSIFNRILFGKLRLINDIDSYRVYGVFLSACLVGLLYYWLSKTYGRIAGFFASLSLSLYPLFWAESHFNTEKDIPETVFWSFFLYSVWKGVREKSPKWILLSGIFFGLALGTKFNILFSIFVIIPWVLFLLIFQKLKISEALKNTFWGIVAFLIGLALFIGSWPYLWTDTITKVSNILGFYKEIGANGANVVNGYPIQWIIYTTPLIILALFSIGLVTALYRVIKKKDDLSLLFLLWLMVPILRVVAPGASFYGGVRQIMEYVPAMAIIAGLGAQAIYNKHCKGITVTVLLLAFLPITLKLISIHPNENVYFNPLIGGLTGAKKADLPYWGFSFGAPYRQGVEWLNNHAETGAHIAYAFELIPNFPRLWLRPDLLLHNNYRSGYLLQGEYAITLTYQGLEQRSYYEMYLNKFIKPVYQITIDGVAILKIWKNDKAHLKIPFIEENISNVVMSKDGDELIFDLGTVLNLSRLEIEYNKSNCSELTEGYVYTSQDKINWKKQPGTLPDDWRIAVLGKQPNNGSFIEPFVGYAAHFIKIQYKPADTCLKNVKLFKVYQMTNE